MLLADSFLKGLYDFKIEQVDIRPLMMSGIISVSFEKLIMEGLHSTRAVMLSGISPVTVEGYGFYSMNMSNFRLSAFIEVEFVDRIRPNLKNIYLTYSTFSVQSNFTGFGPIWTEVFNRAANIALPAYVLISNVNTNLWVNQELIPAINGIINDLTIIDIISIIRGLINRDGNGFDAEIMKELSRYEEMLKNMH